MLALKYLAPALAVIGGAAAATCSVSATTTISSSADATNLASCQTFTGSIAIATGNTDAIALDGIQTITGNLIANNVTQMTELSGDSLTNIQNAFYLNSLTILSTLNFPMLTEVDIVMWTALPALQGLSFTDSLQKVNSLTIINTQLNSLNGIDLQTANEVQIADNNYLEEISMQLGHVGQAITVAANGGQLTVEFPNMLWANNMSIRDASSLSIPSLTVVNGSLGFYSNSFQSLAAPNLTMVGGGLAVVSNDQLTNVSMPVLTKVGGAFQIANNTALSAIDGFPDLQAVGGAVDLAGTFNNASLPALKDVVGGFNIESTKNINSTCSTFQSLAGKNNVIHGTYSCMSVSNPGTGTLNPSSGTGSGSSATSSGAADVLAISGATGLLGVVAAIFGLL